MCANYMSSSQYWFDMQVVLLISNNSTTFPKSPQEKEFLALKPQFQIKIFDKCSNYSDFGHDLKNS